MGSGRRSGRRGRCRSGSGSRARARVVSAAATIVVVIPSTVNHSDTFVGEEVEKSARHVKTTRRTAGALQHVRCDRIVSGALTYLIHDGSCGLLATVLDRDLLEAVGSRVTTTIHLQLRSRTARDEGVVNITYRSVQSDNLVE